MKKNALAILLMIISLAGCNSGPRHSPSPRSKSIDDMPSQPTERTDSQNAPRYKSASSTIASNESRKSSESLRYVPWPQRRGPAYPDDFWRSWGRDSKEFAPRLWDDTKALVKNPCSLLCLGSAGVAGIVLHGPNADDRVQRYVEKHGSQLNTFWDTAGDAGGNPGVHFALAGALYFTSLARQDLPHYESSKTLLRALAFNGIVTSILKISARTEAPNGNENVWPSGHTSSSFTLATVMWHEYGPWVGVPLTAFAGYVGYERIDARNHHFSDVISGAFIGIAIGHAVSKNEEIRLAGFTVAPYVDHYTGSAGLALAKRW